MTNGERRRANSGKTNGGARTATWSTDERLLRLLRSSPEQQAAIDRILEGRVEAPHPAPSGPRLMMMGDAARLLGVSRTTIWRMMKLGKLEGVEILPGTVRVRRSDVEGSRERMKLKYEGTDWRTANGDWRETASSGA